MESVGRVDGDLDGRAAGDLWAASGAQWLSDPAIGVPVSLVRRVVGLTESLDRRGAALSELVGARGLGFLAERAATLDLPRAGDVSAGGATRLLRAADGWFVLSLARPEDRLLLDAWLERTISDDGDVWRSVEDAVADRPVGPLSERGALLGLPCAAVGEVTDDVPVVADHVAPGASRPLDSARVVNLAALWAGPLCADVLARLGARSITVESTHRPDGGRLAADFFAALHGRSESVALDLRTPDGRHALRRLVASADVVIEGSRPRALEQLGIDARAIVATGPKVWVSITARGRGPGDRDRVGFGDDAAAAGGLVGWAGGAPRFVADAVADPLTGLTAAHAVAELLDGEGRWLADVALARVARSVAGGAFVDVTGTASAPRRRRDPGRPLPLGRDTDAVLGHLRRAPP